MPVRPSSPFRKLQSVRARTAAASLMVAGSLALTLLPAAHASTPVTRGYRADTPYTSAGVTEPTGEKPESKLWYNDGFWWASMFDPTNPETASFDSGYYVAKLNPVTQNWDMETNRTSLDSRNSSKADTLWDGTKLYVASHIKDGDAFPSSTGPGNEKRFYRYSYNASTDKYTIDSGFSTPTASAPGGAIIAENSSETLTLAKETTAGGKLWVTWTEADMVDGDLDPTTPPTAGPVRVKVAYSTTGGTTWTPMNLPVTAGTADNLTLDDISTIVAFNNRIGVMWSNQTTKKTYFAVHADASDPTLNWGSGFAVYDAASGDATDDHLNIKLQTDASGRLFAVTKTGFSAEGRDDIVLLACTNGTCGSAGNWSRYTGVHGSGRDRRRAHPSDPADRQYRQRGEGAYLHQPADHGRWCLDLQEVGRDLWPQQHDARGCAVGAVHPERHGHQHQQPDHDQADRQQHHRLGCAGQRR
jgi:hypothetical protein